MDNTIECNFGMTCGDDGNLSRPFLRKISFIRPGGLETLGLVHLEFTEIPEAIRKIRSKREAEGCESPFFTIDSISEHGVLLADSGRNDAKRPASHYFYIPSHRIACIHTVDAS